MSDSGSCNKENVCQLDGLFFHYRYLWKAKICIQSFLSINIVKYDLGYLVKQNLIIGRNFLVKFFSSNDQILG